jgi:hypothetical protein
MDSHACASRFTLDPVSNSPTVSRKHSGRLVKGMFLSVIGLLLLFAGQSTLVAQEPRYALSQQQPNYNDSQTYSPGE